MAGENAIVAEVSLNEKLRTLASTKYDPLEPKRRYLYLLEIFGMQTKNILNASKYDRDAMLHVSAEEFEQCKANEWFLASSLLDGFSPGEIEINKDRFERIEEQLQSLQCLSREETIDHIKS